MSKTIEENRNISTMSVGEAKRLFTGLVKSLQPGDTPTLTVIGQPGIGKTDMAEQIAQQCGLSLVTRQMSQVHPLEMGAAGLDSDKRVMYFARPVLHEAVMSVPAPRLLFIDEIDRVAPMGQNALMQILLSREQCGYKFEDTYVMCAANAWHAQYTFEFDKAMASRLAIAHVEPRTDEWLLWAAEHNLDPRVIVTISQCPDVLNQHGSMAEGALKVADPRSWARLSTMLRAGMQPEQAGVMVGEHAAQKFMLFANIDREYSKEIGQVLRGKPVSLTGVKEAERDKILFVIYLAAAGQVKEIPMARQFLINGSEQIGDERTYIASRLITFNIKPTDLTADPVIKDIHLRIYKATVGGK